MNNANAAPAPAFVPVHVFFDRFENGGNRYFWLEKKADRNGGGWHAGVLKRGGKSCNVRGVIGGYSSPSWFGALRKVLKAIKEEEASRLRLAR